MAENKDEELWESAASWKAAAIAIAVITPCVCAFTLPWVFAATDDENMLHRVQIVGVAAAFGLALITFCTVVWRGIISTQQAKLQRMQIDRLTVQISETAKVNSATLLQNGAELLAEIAKPAHVSAGIATLSSVAGDTDDRFAVQAMNLLAEYVQENGKNSHRPTKVKSAIGLLNAVWRNTGRRAELPIRFDALIEGKTTTWEMVFWAARVTYRGGVINDEDMTEFALGDEQPRLFFSGVNFNRCNIYRWPTATFVDCTFLACPIVELSPQSLIKNKFERCDFSGALIGGLATPFPDLRNDGNWYKPETPPRWKVRREEGFDWDTVLLNQRPLRLGPARRPPEE